MGLDPFADQSSRCAKEIAQQNVHVLFQFCKMSRPLGRFGNADVLLALPLHWVEEKHAVGSDEPARAGGERPQGRRRALTGDDSRGPNATQTHERDKRHRAVRATARRIKIDRALTPRLNAE